MRSSLVLGGNGTRERMTRTGNGKPAEQINSGHLRRFMVNERLRRAAGRIYWRAAETSCAVFPAFHADAPMSLAGKTVSKETGEARSCTEVAIAEICSGRGDVSPV